MSAGGPSKLSDFSEKETAHYTQVYKRIVAKIWSFDDVKQHFKNDSGLLARFGAFYEIKARDEQAQIQHLQNSCQKSILFLSDNISKREQHIMRAKISGANAIVKESQNISISPPKP